MSAALQYVNLIGKYVRMERPADDEEIAAAVTAGVIDPGATDYMVGCEGTVAAVWDSYGCKAVDIMMDYGMGYTVHLVDERLWRFAVTDTEQTMISTHISQNGIPS